MVELGQQDLVPGRAAGPAGARQAEDEGPVGQAAEGAAPPTVNLAGALGKLDTSAGTIIVDV